MAIGFRLRSRSVASTGSRWKRLASDADEPFDLRLRHLDLERDEEAGPLDAGSELHGLVDIGHGTELPGGDRDP